MKESKSMLASLILLSLSILLGGCQVDQPTRQAVLQPSTATPTTLATAKPLITTTHSVAPTNTATATQSPPTPVISGPVIMNLLDQSISDGERFPKMELDSYVSDRDHAAGEMQWQITNNEELELRLIGHNLFVSLPRTDWTGSEILQFEVCDPTGLCASQEVVFTVRAENDAPVVAIGGQVIMNGETFSEINLKDFGHDEDNADEELTWSLSGNAELDVAIHEGVARIETREAGWLGSEIIRFEACDSGSACGSQDVVFSVMAREGSQVEVTYIGNAGFMLDAGGKKILIDALCEEPSPPREIAESLERAQPPFDDVDLILISHSHFDHFSAEKVHSHLEHNPDAILVAPYDVVNAVSTIGNVRDRTIPIRLQQRAGEKTHLNVAGIGLEAIYLSHGGPILNLGYVITAAGRRLFHTGDIDPDTVRVSELQSHKLPEKQIDIAFVPHFMLIQEGQLAYVTEGIQARHVVPMHYQFTVPPPDYERMAAAFPDAIIFREAMESWVLPRASQVDSP